MAKKASKVRNDPGESVKPDPVEKKLEQHRVALACNGWSLLNN